jgi:predicted secreted acid phosphatase
MTKIYNSLVDSFYSELNMYNNNKYKPCVVFDIDGTILVDGIYAPSKKNEIISDVYNFLLHLQNNNIEIFIITARPDFPHNRSSTMKMLKTLDIDYTYLYMWDQKIFNNHEVFKRTARKEIFDNNYNIIMSLGDNYWDYGDYGGLGVHIYNDGQKIKYITDYL